MHLLGQNLLGEFNAHHGLTMPDQSVGSCGSFGAKKPSNHQVFSGILSKIVDLGRSMAAAAVVYKQYGGDSSPMETRQSSFGISTLHTD